MKKDIWKKEQFPHIHNVQYSLSRQTLTSPKISTNSFVLVIFKSKKLLSHHVIMAWHERDRFQCKFQQTSSFWSIWSRNLSNFVWSFFYIVSTFEQLNEKILIYYFICAEREDTELCASFCVLLPSSSVLNHSSLESCDVAELIVHLKVKATCLLLRLTKAENVIWLRLITSLSVKPH